MISHFSAKKVRSFGRIFSARCQNCFDLFQRRSARYIFFFHFWKKLSLFSFNLFGVWSMFFFKNPPKFSREPCKSCVFESTEKFLRQKFFYGKKLFHFICSRIFDRRKVGVMATPFEQELKIAVFLPRWIFKVYFFFDNLERSSILFISIHSVFEPNFPRIMQKNSREHCQGCIICAHSKILPKKDFCWENFCCILSVLGILSGVRSELWPQTLKRTSKPFFFLSIENMWSLFFL